MKKSKISMQDGRYLFNAPGESPDGALEISIARHGCGGPRFSNRFKSN